MPIRRPHPPDHVDERLGAFGPTCDYFLSYERIHGGRQSSRIYLVARSLIASRHRFTTKPKGVYIMAAGQQSGTGAMTELDDEKVRKNDILSNRDKAKRPDGQSLDSVGVQVDEYKDIPTNQRPEAGDAPEPR